MIVSAAVERTSQLVGMRRAGIVPQNMPEDVERGEGNPVGFGQGRNLAPFNRENCPAVPEFASVRDADAVAAMAPKGVMQFDRNGNVGIVIIAAPFPGKRLDEWPGVVVGQLSGAVIAIADLLQGSSGAGDVLGKAQEIEIALVAPRGVNAEIMLVREAF